MFANGCFVTDGNHRFDDPTRPVPWQGFTTKGPTRIGDNVWCGAHAVVTSGVTIGERCVIGANSVVTTDLPPFSIAAGAPARVLRTIEYADHGRPPDSSRAAVAAPTCRSRRTPKTTTAKAAMHERARRRRRRGGAGPARGARRPSGRCPTIRSEKRERHADAGHRRGQTSSSISPTSMRRGTGQASAVIAGPRRNARRTRPQQADDEQRRR